jgi:hypothetical protein
MLLIGQAFRPRCCRVRMNAVVAAVHCGNGYIDQFFREWIKRAGRNHYLFHARPCSFQQAWLIRERSPEVINEIRLARGANIVKDNLQVRLTRYLFLCPKLYGCQGYFSMWNDYALPLLRRDGDEWLSRWIDSRN